VEEAAGRSARRRCGRVLALVLGRIMKPAPTLRQAAAVAVALGLALLACKKEAPAPAPATSAAPKPVSTGPCPDGHSADPKHGELRPAITAFNDKHYDEAKMLLDHLIKDYPHSATLRVWRGDATLFAKHWSDGKKTYQQAADDALVFYKEAAKLHDQECTLPDVEHYYLRMDTAYAYLRKEDANSALVELEIAKKNWSNSAEVFYTLARAYCLKKDVDNCADNFKQALEIAKALKRPRFLRVHRSLDDWIQRSRRQSEFLPLRRDKRYGEIVKKVNEAY
jgi:tetratricopeptide (TPR) repeat protein